MSMIRLTVFLACVSASGAIEAAPVTLKCTTSSGTPAADLTIELDRGRMSWGGSEYKIIHVNDRYISAYLERRGVVGGEVWVLDRVTGEYKRGSVAMLMSLEEANAGGKGTLQATTYEGKCAAPML